MSQLMKFLLTMIVISVFFPGTAEELPLNTLENFRENNQSYQIKGDENSLFPQEWQFSDLRPGGTVSLICENGKITQLRGDGKLIWGGKITFLRNKNGDYIIIDGGFKLIMQLEFNPIEKNPVAMIIANFEAINALGKNLYRISLLSCQKVSNNNFILSIDLKKENFFDNLLGANIAASAELFINGEKRLITGWIIRDRANQPLLTYNFGNYQITEINSCSNAQYQVPTEFKTVKIANSDELYACFKNKGKNSYERAQSAIKKQWDEFNFNKVIDYIFANMLPICIGLFCFSAAAIIVALKLKKRRTKKKWNSHLTD